MNDTRSLRRILKQSLRPRTVSITNHEGQWKPWFENKVNALSSFSMADRSRVPALSWEILALRYVRGIPKEQVARLKHLSPRQIDNHINAALDCLIKAMPPTVAASISQSDFTWQCKACTHCGGDLFWDEEGTQKNLEGEWVCLQCARRFDADMEPLRHTATVIMVTTSTSRTSTRISVAMTGVS